MKRDILLLDATLECLFKDARLPGISVAAWGPEGEMFARGYGRTSDKRPLPIDPDTVFGIASMSKSMTALACAILATEGRLSFDDPVYHYFPNFSVRGIPRDAITLRHLAMHTAGIPPIEPVEWSIAMHAKERSDDWIRALRKTAPNPFDTINQLIDYIATCGYAPLGAPGEYMSYCNEGYALLSYVVDQAAEMPLEQFLSERVFAPLGMDRTVLDVDATEAIALAGGNITSLFERVDGRLTCDDEWSVLPPYRGCGLVKSTARNMAAYYRCLSNYGMHEGEQALPREAVEMMVGRAFPVQKVPVYALGLNKREIAGHVICEHAGALHGTSSFGGLLLGEGWGFAALCNLGDVDVDTFGWAMYNWAMGLPLDTSHRWYSPTGKAFSDPEMAVGTFRCHEGLPVDVTVFQQSDGTLHVRKEAKELPLLYCGGSLFVAYEENGNPFLRMRIHIRDGKAWAATCGTRMYQRV